MVTEVTPWNGKLMALNNSGFGGTNSHALFEVNSKTKLRNSKPSDNLPWLIVASGRTVEAVDVILKHVGIKVPIECSLLTRIYWQRHIIQKIF